MLKCGMGFTHKPNTAEFEVMVVVLAGSNVGFGVWKEMDPSGFCVHPSGRIPPTSAQFPRAALFGKYIAFCVL
jgi:hypothetical protein